MAKEPSKRRVKQNEGERTRNLQNVDWVKRKRLRAGSVETLYWIVQYVRTHKTGGIVPTAEQLQDYRFGDKVPRGRVVARMRTLRELGYIVRRGRDYLLDRQLCDDRNSARFLLVIRECSQRERASGRTGMFSRAEILAGAKKHRIPKAASLFFLACQTGYLDRDPDDSKQSFGPSERIRVEISYLKRIAAWPEAA